jgi:hypothetical protein
MVFSGVDVSGGPERRMRGVVVDKVANGVHLRAFARFRAAARESLRVASLLYVNNGR